jgi:hypothetical protein
MAAAVAIIGAVSGTVGTINTIKTWVESLERFVREFKEAGELLLRLNNNIRVCEYRLDLWRKFWELNGASGPYMRELWGSRGTDTILSQLTTIESLCNIFHEALHSFFGNTSLAQQIYSTTSDAFGSTSSRLAVFQAYANTIKLTTSNTQTFSFVRTLNARASEWLSQLKPLLAELESDALRTYNIRHRQDAKTSLPQEQRDMIHAGVLMQIAMNYRNSAEELFKMCFDMETGANIPGRRRNVSLAQGSSIKLKVDLMADSSYLELQRASSEQDIIERYHLLVKEDHQGRSPSEAELCIIRAVAAVPQLEILQSIPAAYQTALREKIPVHALCRGTMFCFRPPLEDERLMRGDRPAVPLKELLKAADPDTFLLQDRVHLAYKVIECGAFLTGTSWLGSLRTNNMVRSRFRAGFYYTLDIHSPARAISRRSLSTHILLIGTLLIEIGTGMLLKDIASGGEDILFQLEPLEIRAPQTRASGLYTTEQVKSLLIQNNMGNSYTSAALHCFGPEIRRKCEALVRSKDGDIFESYKEVLRDYFLNVYSPYV